MQIADLRGIDNTLEVLQFAAAARNTFLDGVSASDIKDAPTLVALGIKAYRGADEIPAELRELSADEREVIGDELQDLFGPILTGIAERIDASTA